MTMSLHVTLTSGDGIGPAITDATVRLLAASGAGVRVNTEERYIGIENHVTVGEDPHAVAQSVAIMARLTG